MNFQYGLLHLGANKFFALSNNYQTLKLLQILLLKTTFFSVVHFSGCEDKHKPLIQEKTFRNIGIGGHLITGLTTDLGIIDRYSLAASAGALNESQLAHFTLSTQLLDIIDDVVAINDFLATATQAIELKYHTTQKYMQLLVPNDSGFGKFFEHDEHVEKQRLLELREFYNASISCLFRIDYTEPTNIVFANLKKFFNEQQLYTQIANHFKNKILSHESLQ